MCSTLSRDYFWEFHSLFLLKRPGLEVEASQHFGDEVLLNRCQKDLITKKLFVNDIFI